MGLQVRFLSIYYKRVFGLALSQLILDKIEFGKIDYSKSKLKVKLFMF